MRKKSKQVPRTTPNTELVNAHLTENAKVNSIDSAANLAGQAIPNKRHFDWNAVTGLTSTIALIFLAVAAFYNAAQIRTARQIAQAQSVMEYYKLLQDYNDIQIKLVDGGEWSTAGKGPSTPEEWFRVRRYMGLLEQIEVLIASDVIALDVADGNYSHRIRAIYNNDVIRRVDLEEQAFRWGRFLKLVDRLKSMPVYKGLTR